MRKRMLIVMLVLLLSLAGCGIASLESSVNDIKGQLIGISFECQFYDNYGEKFLTASGTKVGMTGNIIEEAVIDSSDGSTSTEYVLSSVVTISIDGNELQSCGDTIIFEESGLKPDTEFQLMIFRAVQVVSLPKILWFLAIVNNYKQFLWKRSSSCNSKSVRNTDLCV